MYLINEENYIRILRELIKNSLDSLLKLTTVFCTRNHSCKIESYNSFVKQDTGDLTLDYPKRKTLYNR